MSAQPSTDGNVAVITFELNLSTLIPNQGKIVLSFSNGFNLQSSQAITCNSTYALNSLNGCTVNSPTQLTLNNATSSDYLVIFTIRNVLLPAYVSSFFVVVTSYQADGRTQIENSGPTAFKITTTPGSLFVNLLPASQLVGDQTDLQITLTSSLWVNQSGSILIKLPKWNAGTQTLSLVLPYFNVLNLIPDPISGSYSIPCMASLHPQLICSFTVNQATDTSSISQTFDILKIQQFSSDFQSILLTTTGGYFQNPPSTKKVNTFSASTLNSLGALITSVSKVSLSVSQAAVLPSSYVTLQTQESGINVQTPITFTVEMPLPGPVGLQIMITIPSQLGIVSLQNPSQVVLTSAAGYLPIAEIPYLQILNQTSSNQTLMLSLLVPNSNYYVDQGNFVKFQLFDIVNAPSIELSDSFQISFYEFDDLIMTVKTGLSIIATPGELSNIQIEPQGYRVRDQVPYSFSFVTTNRVFSDGIIQIYVPPELTIIKNNLTVICVTTLTQDGTATIHYNTTTKAIQIFNGFPQDFNTPQLIQFIIQSGLVNAQSTQPISSFIIQTLDGSGAIIDSGTSENLTFTPNEISQILTYACSDKMTASMTEDVCTYKLQFMIGSQYPITAGSYIQIDLPDDLNIFSQQITQQRSSTIGIADFSSQFQVINNGQTIQVNNAFIATSAPNGIDYRQDSFAVCIASIISPRTTAPTLSFKARIYSADGFLEYTKSQGVYANVYEARPFSLVAITRTNVTNGDESGIYNFTLQFSSVVYKNEYIMIQAPNSVVIYPGGPGQCSGTRLLNQQLACNIVQGSLYVLIEPANSTLQNFNPGDIVQFQVSNIRNPLSLEPSTSFDIYAATSTSQNYFINQMVQGLSILNSLEGQLNQVRVQPNSNKFGALTDYQIYFVTANLLDIGSFIQIQFPSNYYQFSGSIWPCTAIKNIQSSLVCTPSNSSLITITNGFSQTPVLGGTEIGLILKGINNPQQSVSNSVINSNFRIETFTADNYGIDRSQNLNFSIGCTYPCQSCSTLQTQCTSCFPLSNQTPLYLYQSTCNVACPVGTYSDKNNICQPCNTLCEQCSISADICDSCRSDTGFPYLTSTGTCTAKCVDGTFLNPSTLTCQICQGNCYTCSSAIECLSCDKGYFFIEGQCLATCPNYSIQFDSVEVEECLKCQNPCATCQGTVTNCTSCSPSTFLYNGVCQNQCPATYLPDQNNICYKASQRTLPFITLTMPVAIILLIFISLCIQKKTKGFTAFLAMQSVAMVLFWSYMLAFLIMDNHTASASLVSIALFANFVVNYLWYEFYKDLRRKDSQFLNNCKSWSWSSRLVFLISMLTSFQFFRMSNSEMFNSPALKVNFQLLSKYHKKMNRYSLFQITFTYILTIIAAIYNLFYTWYGRQIYWIDIENIAVSSLMIIYHLIVIFENEKAYIKKLLHIDQQKKTAKVQSGVQDGEDDQQDRGLMSLNEQKALKVASAIEEDGIATSRWMIKDLNHEQRMLAVKAVFYKLITGKKLNQNTVQSSAGILQGDDKYILKHGRDKINQLSEQQLKKVSSSNKKRKVDYEEINAGDTMQMTQILTLDDGSGAPLHTVILKSGDQDDEENESQDNARQIFMDKELLNFQSAPLNAESALKGNKDLETRHKNFQDELAKKKKNKMNKNQNEMQFDKESKNTNSLHFRNGTMASQFLLDLPADSDDQIENFTSEQWGPGASKVVAEHFNTQQARSFNNTGQQIQNSNKWAQSDKSTIPNGKILTNKLTKEQFLQKIEEVKTQQVAKRQAKEKAFEFQESSKKLGEQLTSQNTENQKLRDLIKALELQIAGEFGRLNGVLQSKKEDVELAEKGFYTSNEDGMGVSPNEFLQQNRMQNKQYQGSQTVNEMRQFPLNESLQEIESQSLKKSKTKSSEINSQRLSKSKTQKSGSKSISASEIKALMALQGSGETENDQDDENQTDQQVIQSSGTEAKPKKNIAESVRLKRRSNKSKSKSSQRRQPSKSIDRSMESSMRRNSSALNLPDNSSQDQNVASSFGEVKRGDKKFSSKSQSRITTKKGRKQSESGSLGRSNDGSHKNKFKKKPQDTSDFDKNNQINSDGLKKSQKSGLKSNKKSSQSRKRNLSRSNNSSSIKRNSSVLKLPDSSGQEANLPSSSGDVKKSNKSLHKAITKSQKKRGSLSQSDKKSRTSSINKKNLTGVQIPDGSSQEGLPINSSLEIQKSSKSLNKFKKQSSKQKLSSNSKSMNRSLNSSMRRSSSALRFQAESSINANLQSSASDIIKSKKNPQKSSGTRNSNKKGKSELNRLLSLGLNKNSELEIPVNGFNSRSQRRQTTDSNNSIRSKRAKSDNRESYRALPTVTEGNASRKPHPNNSLKPGLKALTTYQQPVLNASASQPLLGLNQELKQQKSNKIFATNIKELGGESYSENEWNSRQRQNRELLHPPLDNKRDKYEYYTSQDEFGQPVNKLRRKSSKSARKNKNSKQGQQNNTKYLKIDSLKEQDHDDYEFYSSFDNQGLRVQKLRKKGKQQRSKSQNTIPIGAQSQNNPSNSQFTQVAQQLGQDGQRKGNFNFRPEFKDISVEQSTIKGSVLGATGENFTRFSLLSSRGAATSNNENPPKNRGRSNNLPAQSFNVSANRGTGTQQQNERKPDSQIISHKPSILDRNPGIATGHSSALRDAGITVLKTQGAKPEKRNRSKKVSAPARDYSGPYFNHTNFEKAVIATNGKHPFNNKEVEKISKQQDLSKNNWFNNILNESKMIIGNSGSQSPVNQRNNQRRIRQDDIASASVTATTVFQGVNQSQNLGSLQQTHIKPKGGLSQTQQQFGFGGSPVTLRQNQVEGATAQLGHDLSPLGTNDGGGRYPAVGSITKNLHTIESSENMASLAGNLMYEQAQNYFMQNTPKD